VVYIKHNDWIVSGRGVSQGSQSGRVSQSVEGVSQSKPTVAVGREWQSACGSVSSGRADTLFSRSASCEVAVHVRQTLLRTASLLCGVAVVVILN
jgi:hypothetical protein